MTTSTDNTTAETAVTPFKCPKCPKAFATQSGVQMHDMRVHSSKLGKGYRWKAKGVKAPVMTHEEKLAVRREYNRKWRARRGIKPSPHMYHSRTSGGNKGMRLPEWTQERRARFSRTMKRVAREKAQQALQQPMRDMQHEIRKRIQFVYPTPEQQNHTEPTAASAIKFCPHCGHNIEKHL